MRYGSAYIIAAGALAAIGNGAPIAQKFTIGEPSTIGLGKPSTEVTWGKRDTILEKPDTTISIGKPSTEVTWGKRDTTKSGQILELGEPTTVVTWGKRDQSKDIIELGKPSTEVTWS